MVSIILFEKHTAADCSVGNEKALKASIAVKAKLPELYNKYGIKFIGAWAIHPQHLVVYIFDAPSMEAIQRIELEPEVMNWRCFTTADYQLAAPMEEVEKFFARKIAIAAKAK